MNYELAKKLKDAGFPQNRKLGFYITRIDEVLRTERGPEMCYAPTLEELIEVCGKGWKLYFLLDGYATAGEGESIGQLYNTPEEAVANLWLQLNSK